MKTVAIIKCTERFDPTTDDTNSVINSITDWVDITEEEYNILIKYQYEHYRNSGGYYLVLEKVKDQKQYISNTVEAYLKAALKAEKEKEEAAEKKKLAAIERKNKKFLKDKESKIKLLQQLKAELGEV